MPGESTELAALADLLEARAAGGQRVIVALAGAPGSGKSTLADKLVGKLNARQAGLAAVLPMDGYHYDDLYLVPAGLRPRKGAPMTFDVGGLYHTLKRMRARLRGRWERLGLTEDQIIEKLEENDLPNGRWVRDGSIRADHVIRNG